MAKNPSNRGIGSGSAQVYDMSRLDNAMGDFFNTVGRKDLKFKKDKDAAAASKAKALKELRGDYGDYDTDKMREADKETAVQMNEEGFKELEGHWGDILNGDPKWSNRYREILNENKIFISNSVESKQEMKDMYSTINEPDSGYSPEKIKIMEEAMLATGSTMKGMKEAGLYAPDTIIGDPLSRVDDAFRDSGDELYTIKETSYPNAQGQIIKTDVKVWKDDAEALPKFKATVGANPRLMSDMNIKYPGLSVDEQYQKLYDEYKQSRETEQKDVSIGREPKDDGGGFGINPKFNIALKTKAVPKRGLARGKTKDEEIITLAKKSGSALSPITLNGKTGVVSEIIKKNGKWTVTRALTKESIGGEISLTGEVVKEPVDETMGSHLESTYGITDIEGTLKELKGSNAPATEDFRKKYNY